VAPSCQTLGPEGEGDQRFQSEGCPPIVDQRRRSKRGGYLPPLPGCRVAMLRDWLRLAKHCRIQDDWRQPQAHLAAMRLAPLLRIESALLVFRRARAHAPGARSPTSSERGQNASSRYANRVSSESWQASVND
jgi:hypothetical protein